MKTKPIFAALVATTISLSIVNAQHKGADPYKATQKAGTHSDSFAPQDQNKYVSICYEEFSAPIDVVASLQRMHIDDAKLYAKMVDLMEKNEAIQETFVMLRAQSNGRSESKSNVEMIYPTEFRSVSTPDVVAKTQDKKDAGATAVTDEANRLPAAALPSKFETRYTGYTLEMHPILLDDGKSLDLNFQVNHVTYLGQSKIGRGSCEVEIPLFEYQSIRTLTLLSVGRPCLMGTMNPAPGLKAAPDSAKRVWLAFITATLPK